MRRQLTRRALIARGLMAAAGATGLGTAAYLAERHGLVPPDHAGLYGLGESLTYASHRLLTSGGSRAREFDRSQISTVIPVNGTRPEVDAYQRLIKGQFADWRLTIDGLVARPRTFSLAELQRFLSHTQITHQACEEGWSFIAEWRGARLSDVLLAAGVLPHAKWVFFFTFDGWWDSLDVPEALHPQTFLAYGMNGGEIPLDHGAPVRLRVPRQLGYKSLKYLSRITVTDTMQGVGDGLGSNSPSAGYSWYAGI